MEACHLYLDSAELGALRDVLPHPLVYGVTTNPTLLKKAGVTSRDLGALVSDVFAAGVRAVHLQAVGQTQDELVASGLEHAQLAASGPGEPGQVFVKLPATREGFAAAAKLTAEGVRVTVTAVYRPEQVLFAASTGALYAAPYLGRLQDGGHDGLAVIGRMQALLDRYAVTTTRLPRRQRAVARGGCAASGARCRQYDATTRAFRRALELPRNRRGGGDVLARRPGFVTVGVVA